MFASSVLTSLVLASSLLSRAKVNAQPSPEVQKNITKAIEAAQKANGTSAIDYTELVNVFIGTDNYGDVCPGASVPFGMVKFTTDFTGYAPAGYVTDNTQTCMGMSPLHDSGTGSSLGSYGNFKIMPLLCPDGFDTCTTVLSARERYRKNNTDVASPGYFALTLDNDIKMEATSTRRAGLERFTFPKNKKPYFVLDLANDLPMSFGGGVMNIDPDAGRITLGGRWNPSFGPSWFFYQAFACYDILNNGSQTLDEYGVWTGDEYGLDAKGLGMTHLNLSLNLIGSPPYQSGALFSFKDEPEEIIIRVGVSFVSADQACSNAESEVGASTFEEIVNASKALWNEKLSKIEIDVANTKPNITELFYSSFYRSQLTPNNATDEGSGAFLNTTAPYFDSLYCSWDTFRTFYPLLALHSPVEFSEITNAYIDTYHKNGFLPECRSNQLPGWTQGGSNGDNIVGHFAMTYHDQAADLGVNLTDLYMAMWADAEVNPGEWNTEGRQIDVYKEYGYVPFGALDTSSTGRITREASRTLEYAFNDFAVRQVALLLNKTEDEAYYANRSLNYRNVFDPDTEDDGYKGFAQKRHTNGSFIYITPKACSPIDNDTSRACSLEVDNLSGFFESSSWEYTWFAPHDTAHLVEVLGGNETFLKRLDHYFDAGYYAPGNEPSFQPIVGYHYAGEPTRTVERIRQSVFQNFDITPAGLPGNDDQCAMGSWLLWNLLGFFPVASTSEMLITSPFIPSYTIHNSYLNVSTTVKVVNFDPASVNETIPAGASAWVHNVTVNGVATESRCHFDFYDTFKKGGDIVITLTSDKSAANSCNGSLPESISTGGFAVAR